MVQFNYLDKIKNSAVSLNIPQVSPQLRSGSSVYSIGIVNSEGNGKRVSFSKALTRLDDFDLVLVAWEEEHALPMSKAVRAAVEKGEVKRVAIVVGPEGGISQAEWEKLHEMGAVSVTLGPRILRTETAGLCALSVLWTALGEM